MDLGMNGARAVVTGGSKGMGRAIAERLAAEGAEVAVFARGEEALDETVAALHERSGAGAPLRSASTSGSKPRSRTPSPSWKSSGRPSTSWSTRSAPAPDASRSSTTPPGRPPWISG